MREPERVCRICDRPYRKGTSHVKQYHPKKALEEYIKAHIVPELQMCDICKTVFDEDPKHHVAYVHKDMPFKEFVNNLC